MHYKITIEYDGTNYVGWQKQPDQKGNSIEEILEQAVFNMTQERVKINGSGRTDAGVHAIAQVADFAITKEIENFRIMVGLNNHLRESNVVITNCEKVSDEFNSRFSAKLRTYRYVIINRKSALALQKNRAWHVPVALNDAAMNEAASHLIGEHDFSAFRDAECQSKTPVKTVEKITINRNGEELIIEISAKSFLHHMVRNIVGTLVLVGSGKIAAQDVLEILQSKDRKKSGPNAPACGLYFLGVDY